MILAERERERMEKRKEKRGKTTTR